MANDSNFTFTLPWPTPFIILLFLPTTTTTTSSSPPPLPPPPPTSSLKPTMAVIVGLLTTIFSLTFLLLLYAKHCRRTSPAEPLFSAPKNSGIDRTIIESLPVFRFASLSGQKDGLECAVCLTRFDPTEALRLLPKCKHAFHVECVDTWLDAHSTCPLCRYRVDPEDIFLLLQQNDVEEQRELSVRRVSGRHSSAGERVTGLQISVESGSRRSLDSSAKTRKGKKESLERQRKDGLLLGAAEKRLEHRIIVGGERWSDVQASDELYLRREMILSDSRGWNGWWQQGGRSVSEITGLSRFGSHEEAGVLSRWLARVSEPKSQPQPTPVFRSSSDV